MEYEGNDNSQGGSNSDPASYKGGTPQEKFAAVMGIVIYFQ